MNLWANRLLNFIALMGLYLFCVMAFYLSTNNCYFLGGKFIDFSLLGWFLMLAIWGGALIIYFRKKENYLLFFAIQLTVICFAFDWWRLFAFAANLSAKSYINTLLIIEFIAVLIAWHIKNNLLLSSALIALLLIYTGGMIAYPALLSWNQTLTVSTVWALMAALFFSHWLKTKFILLFAIILLGVWGGYSFYHTSGIHFYEPKITKPAGNVKVSIVVPVYNAEKTLERCLDSLRKQTLKDIEIICVNDGSSDKSPQILAEYAAHDARFKVITQENKYVGAARNAGIALASGEFVGFVDSDDWVSLDYFEDMYQTALKYNTDIVMAGNVMEIHNTTLTKRQAAYVDRYFLAKKIISLPLDDVMLLRRLVWDKIYRRSFLLEYHVKSTYRRALYEDFYFFLQTILPQKPIAVALNATYYYFMKNTSLSRASNFSLDDESPLLFVDVDKLVENYPLRDEIRQKWRTYIQNMRIHYLKDYNDALNPVLQPLWQKLCSDLFPLDNFDFEHAEQKLNLF